MEVLRLLNIEYGLNLQPFADRSADTYFASHMGVVLDEQYDRWAAGVAIRKGASVHAIR